MRANFDCMFLGPKVNSNSMFTWFFNLLIHKCTLEIYEKKSLHNNHSTDDDTASDNDNSDEEEVDIDDKYDQDWQSAFLHN